MLEEYRTIPNFPDYKINQNGEVISYRRKNPKKLVGTIDKDGYRIYLVQTPDKKRAYLKAHRIVCQTFNETPKNWGKLCVNHIDGDKSNNHYTNLEWCTVAENNRHQYATGLNKGPVGEKARAAKLTEKDVREIVELLNNTELTQREIGTMYNIGAKAISKINQGQRWKHLGLKVTRR